MAPRKQVPGYALPGQYNCRRNVYDAETKKITSICMKPVPEGELTWLSLNSPKGDYLAICSDCRAELGAVIEEFVAASLGTARLVADLLALPNGQLISEKTLRERLDEAGIRDASKTGLLTEEERSLGLELVRARRRRR